MKKLVWSETWLEGGKPFRGRLRSPPQTTGSFQNIPVSPLDPHWRGTSPPVYYADIATLAYRAPDSERPLATLKVKVTSSAGPLEAAALVDGDLARAISLPFGAASQAWILFAFEKPESIRALTYVVDRPDMHPLQAPLPAGWLEASNDGRDFHKVAELPQTGYIELSALEQTIAFTPTSARFFRVVLERPRDALGSPRDFAYGIAELVLQTAPRVNRFEDKAGFSTRQIVDRDDTPEVKIDSAIKRSDIIDLTQKVGADGSLAWTPPRGRWVVLRFGYSLTGKLNDPASPAGTGLEVDKLNREAVKRYLDAYLGRYEDALGPALMGQKGLQAIVVDSYEAGPQNWTDRMLEEFKARRGYELRPWLPVLTGRVIESAAMSDRLLWDFRKTLGELIREAHYEQITTAAHERGLLRYGESQEFRRFLIGDGMEMKKSADIPMGAMWAGLTNEYAYLECNYAADLRESASVAHLYGKALVAAESFTADGPPYPYKYAPEDLKPLADRMMTEGVNRFVIHTSVHQPDDRPGPGLGLGSIGQWFTRKETWANQAQAWVSYLARSSYLLQQGRFVADIAYLYGEDTNLTALFHASAPSIPEGYSFDYVNADTLLHDLSVQNGHLTSPSGMTYRILVLDASTKRMSVPVLRKIRELVRAGVVVVGGRPTATPSLSDDERAFRALVDELWSGGSNTVGKIVSRDSLTKALQQNGVVPDVIFTGITDATPRFVHRKLHEGDLYFVSVNNANARRIEASFRLTGRKPELWRAETGVVKPTSYRTEGGRTIVPLELEANDAVFVVFLDATSVQRLALSEPKVTRLETLEGPWEVTFPAKLGAPPRARFERLQSWTDRPEEGIKYFSGTARYSKHFAFRRPLKTGVRVEIDLGQVKNLAEMRVNGRSFGVLWRAPFRIDITDALKARANELEIQVTNLWPNRLIGDQQPGAQQIAFAVYDPFKPDSPLLPSGLLGPVTLWSVVEKNNRNSWDQ